MKRNFFVLAAAVALLFNACEKHPAAETKAVLHTEHSEEHGEATGGGGATPHTPAVVPANPAGSGPADQHDPAADKGGGNKEPGAVKYFPQEKK